MRVSSMLRSGVVAIACLGLLLPQAAFAAQQQAQAPKGHPPISILDVALGPQGTLSGTVVDPQGIPQAATPVALLSGKHIVGVASRGASRSRISDAEYTESELPERFALAAFGPPVRRRRLRTRAC